ncbi:MAG: glycosyltransferase family 4 protein [Pseudobacteriovorax sp.]|nr:glycosyltransferase family 4 protein [Pseudobacteriovorax sp.]
MTVSKINVLHLISEKTWRGGENQCRLLIERSADQVRSFAAVPAGSEAEKRLSSIAEVILCSYKPLGLLSSAKKLSKLIREHNIQVIDCQSSKAHNLGLLIKRLHPRIALIVHRRVDYSPGTGWLNRTKYQTSLVDRYVAISDAIARVLVTSGISSDRITTVRSAVDGTQMNSMNRDQVKSSLVSELELDSSVPIIVNIAYHTDQKGHDVLIRALSRLKRQSIRFQCLLAGSGPLTNELQMQAKKLGLSERELLFLGIRNDVPELLLASDIFAMPSNFEGLGTSFLDAMHASLPIAATNVGGIPEIVFHGKNGFLCEKGNEEIHASHLKDLLTHEELRKKLGARGKNMVENEFSLQAMIKGNLAVYHQYTK